MKKILTSAFLISILLAIISCNESKTNNIDPKLKTEIESIYRESQLIEENMSKTGKIDTIKLNLLKNKITAIKTPSKFVPKDVELKEAKCGSELHKMKCAVALEAALGVCQYGDNQCVKDAFKKWKECNECE